jgi:hypothetical protein
MTTIPLSDYEVSSLVDWTLEEVSTYRGECLDATEQLRRLITATLEAFVVVDGLEARLPIMDEDNAREAVAFALRLQEVLDLSAIFEGVVQAHEVGTWGRDFVRDRAEFWSVELGDY